MYGLSVVYEQYEDESAKNSIISQLNASMDKKNASIDEKNSLSSLSRLKNFEEKTRQLFEKLEI